MTIHISKCSYPDDIGREWARANQDTRQAGKSPVLVVRGCCWPGSLVVFHAEDIEALVANHAKLRTAINSI